jgi:hypothetical protein
MSTQSNTQERLYLDDPLYRDLGLLDIFVGLGVLFASLFLAAQMPWLVAVLPISLGPAFYGAQRTLVANRIREPRPRAVDRDRTGRLLVLLTVLGLLSLLLGVVTALGWSAGTLPGWLEAHRAALPAIGFGLPVTLALALTGAVLRIARCYAYALVSALLFVCGYLIGWAVWWSLAGVGAAIAIGGVVALARTFDQHPRASPRR